MKPQIKTARFQVELSQPQEGRVTYEAFEYWEDTIGAPDSEVEAHHQVSQAFQFDPFGGLQESRARAPELQALDRVDLYWGQSVHESLQALSFVAILVQIVDENPLLEGLQSRLMIDLSTSLQQ